MKHLGFLLGLFLFGNLFHTLGQEKGVPEWTLLFFMNADNDLDPYADLDLNDMMKVGSSDQVNLIVEVDRENGPAKRLKVEKGKLNIIQELGEVDMGSAAHFQDFLEWGILNFPSKKIMVSMWNHGTGWYRKVDDGEIRGISYDDSSGNFIKTNQLTEVFGNIHKQINKPVDLLAFDACLMAMPEVYSALMDDVDICVASEEIVPATGWPMEIVCQNLDSNPNLSPEEFSKMLVEEFIKSYSPGGVFDPEEVTYCAIDLRKFKSALPILNKALQEISWRFYEEAIEVINQKALRFSLKNHIDLLHFLKLFSTKIKEKDPITYSLLGEAIGALNESVLLNKNTGRYYDASGYASYFPKKTRNWPKSYLELNWFEKTAYYPFCQEYYYRFLGGNLVRNFYSQLDQKVMSDIKKFTRPERIKLKKISVGIIKEKNWPFDEEVQKRFNPFFE